MSVNANELVVDACTLINLLATGDEVRLMGALGLRLVTCPEAKEEARYVVGPLDEDGRPTRVPLDTDRLVASDFLRLHPLGTVMQDAFVRAVAEGLRDADAAVVALAGESGLSLASDDNKVRKLAPTLYPGIELLSTLGIMKAATTRLGLPEDECRSLLVRLRLKGNFMPPKRDPNRDWFEALTREPATLPEH